MGTSSESGGSSAPLTLKNVVLQNTTAVASSLFYSICSISMVLGNKLLMSTFEPCKQAPFSVLIFQSAVVTVLLLGARALRLVDFPAFDVATALKWLPVNVGFVLMLQTGLMSIGLVAVPMVTVFKNLTNIFTVAGDRIFFGQRVSAGIVLSLVLMLSGALAAAASDLEFKPKGYLYMLANCLSTSTYVLLMRWRTTDPTLKLGKVGMVFYNNLLAVGVGAPFALLMGEREVLARHTDTFSGGYFLLLTVLVAMLGAVLNFAAYWCVSTTSATTYATIGAMNKIPLIVLGAALFGDSLSGKKASFVACSMCGGFVYSYVKFKEAQQARASKDAGRRPELELAEKGEGETNRGGGSKDPLIGSPARLRTNSFSNEEGK